LNIRLRGVPVRNRSPTESDKCHFIRRAGVVCTIDHIGMLEREAPGAEGYRPRGDAAISIRFPLRSARRSGLLTPHRLEGIRALNGLPAKGLSCDGGGGIPAYNTRILSLEVEDHISVSVSIDILQGRLHRRSLSAVWTKADCSLVYSGGIKGIRSQDGHWDHPFASGVDAVRVGAR